MLYFCEREDQTVPHILANCNIDLGEQGASGEQGVWGVPGLMAKIAGISYGCSPAIASLYVC